MKKSHMIILVVIFVATVVGLILGVLKHHGVCVLCLTNNFSPEVIRHYIQGFGRWAIFIYIAFYIINTITLIPPIAIMSLSAGFLFGPILGTVALSLGSFCGVTATFFISRYLGGSFVDKFVKGKAAKFNEKVSKNGFIVLLPMRLIGFPPYEFVNYACGLSKISYRDYISATMLGMAPAIIIQVLLADRFANFNWKDPILYVLIVVFIKMGLITAQIIKKQKEKEVSASS